MRFAVVILHTWGGGSFTLLTGKKEARFFSFDSQAAKRTRVQCSSNFLVFPFSFHNFIHGLMFASFLGFFPVLSYSKKTKWPMWRFFPSEDICVPKLLGSNFTQKSSSIMFDKRVILASCRNVSPRYGSHWHLGFTNKTEV